MFSNKYFANIGRILSSKPPAGFLRAFFGRNFTALKTANPAKGWFRIKPCCAAFRPENPSRKHLPAGRNFPRTAEKTAGFFIEFSRFIQNKQLYWSLEKSGKLCKNTKCRRRGMIKKNVFMHH
ncbi:hypothetical protein B4099_2373 [Heyndrickxia coagulans]|uniref:Uncharacterized protein n=1 Tax=Heyndrickxia coagulans TaxID=1398 RepID=A0A150KGK2_HEYCO|nr:hypothetical protein B4099_2373 [Heyndrickxia coagulans]